MCARAEYFYIFARKSFKVIKSKQQKNARVRLQKYSEMHRNIFVFIVTKNKILLFYARQQF